jgi:hypothetical protein
MASPPRIPAKPDGEILGGIYTLNCHPREGGDPWIPAYAGMTTVADVIFTANFLNTTTS